MVEKPARKPSAAFVKPMQPDAVLAPVNPVGLGRCLSH